MDGQENVPAGYAPRLHFPEGPQRLEHGPEADIGFPVLLIAAVFFAYGILGSLLLSVFAVFGLLLVYWIQSVFLKGRPMAALPPITVMCLIGFLIVSFV